MELANLVLEYLRVLVWPVLTVVLVVLLAGGPRSSKSF
jgi:hypothetical protein